MHIAVLNASLACMKLLLVPRITLTITSLVKDELTPLDMALKLFRQLTEQPQITSYSKAVAILLNTYVLQLEPLTKSQYYLLGCTQEQKPSLAIRARRLLKRSGVEIAALDESKRKMIFAEMNLKPHRIRIEAAVKHFSIFQQKNQEEQSLYSIVADYAMPTMLEEIGFTCK